MNTMRPVLVVPETVPELRGQRVVLRGAIESDIDDRLRYPIDPAEEDLYGGAWRRVWKGQREHTRAHLKAQMAVPPDEVRWCIEHARRAVGNCGLRVDAGNHRASYSIGFFAPELRGQRLGREATRLVASWAFETLHLHRIELQVLTRNERAIRCYESVGFQREGIRREAELYPDGWHDFLYMSLLSSEWTDPSSS